MTQMKNTEVYRVCAGSVNRWQVFKDASLEPVASFHDKASALNYAMCLARGRIAWHLLLRAGGDASANAIVASSGSSH
jgi:hypothetical protein